MRYRVIRSSLNIIINKTQMTFLTNLIVSAILTVGISTNPVTVEPINDDETIVTVAANTEFLSTLVAAVQAGDLVDVLGSEGPFTVFAPTNEAFAALPEGTLETLLNPDNKDQLVSILTYHVVPGKVMSTDLSDGMKATTANGADITININDGKVTVNGANVTAADIAASNGVVHVIDAVILPPSN